jgi:hypothetical protein
LRISACRMCVISNNTLQNANFAGATLKLHNGNPSSGPTFSGVFTEFIEISDNQFSGLSGAQLVENAPQNGNVDERLRNIVFERNLLVPNSGTGESLMVSAQFETVRDNVFFIPSGQTTPNNQQVDIGTRGNFPAYQTSFVQVYNNTCHLLSTRSSQTCIILHGSIPMVLPPISTIVKNTLMFDTASGASAVIDNGTSSTVSNNTATPSNNPSITNGSGSFSLLSDFKPTANYSGGTNVPVWYDALGLPWSPTWDLGAIHP